MGLQPLCARGAVLSLWAGLQVSCGKITVNDLPDRLNYCVIFIVYTQCINVCGPYNTTWQASCWRSMHYKVVSIPLHILAALFLGKETPVRIEWEAGWAPELVRVF